MSFGSMVFLFGFLPLTLLCYFLLPQRWRTGRNLVLQGAGTTFFISLCVVAIGVSAGTVIGALTGYFGGWGDEILMRLCDSITAFPSILLALVVIAVLGPGKWNVIWVLGILFIPSFARIVRGEFARCKHLNYIKSARLMGAGPVRIMVRHILPNTLPVLLPAISIGFNNAVLAEASMSFLGVGVSATEPSLGRMLSDGQGCPGMRCVSG